MKNKDDIKICPISAIRAICGRKSIRCCCRGDPAWLPSDAIRLWMSIINYQLSTSHGGRPHGDRPYILAYQSDSACPRSGNPRYLQQSKSAPFALSAPSAGKEKSLLENDGCGKRKKSAGENLSSVAVGATPRGRPPMQSDCGCQLSTISYQLPTEGDHMGIAPTFSRTRAIARPRPKIGVICNNQNLLHSRYPRHLREKKNSLREKKKVCWRMTDAGKEKSLREKTYPLSL